MCPQLDIPFFFISRLLNFAVLLDVLQEDGEQVQEPTDKLVNLIRIFHAVYFFRDTHKMCPTRFASTIGHHWDITGTSLSFICLLLRALFYLGNPSHTCLNTYCRSVLTPLLFFLSLLCFFLPLSRISFGHPFLSRCLSSTRR